MNGGLRKIPTHEVTYGRLRDMVLFGQLEPGQPVTIQGLIRDLEAGMTPVREAIRRLTAEGALTLQGNRGSACRALPRRCSIRWRSCGWRSSQGWPRWRRRH